MAATIQVKNANGDTQTVATLDAVAALIGEVQPDPTTNTLLERIKALHTALASQATASGQATLHSDLAAIAALLSETLAVAGTVAVSNFPSSQAVTGTFWQATQPISAASLPLPAGAALENGGNLANIAGAVSSAKMATKAAANDFADGALVTLGAKADAAQPDPTQTSSLIALVKGWLTVLGQKADAKSTATDTTAASVMSVLKQISASVQGATPAGTNTIGATTDGGPSWTSAWGISSAPVASADMSSVTNVTDAPTAGQKICIDDVILTNRTTGALECTLKCETTAAVLIGPLQVSANSTIQITPRGKMKLATADKKVTATWSAAGNVNVLIGFHSEA